MGMALTVAEFSQYRLDGDPVPDDVAALLAHSAELTNRLAIEFGGKDWAPWLDTSYLSPEDLANPDIAGNVRAIHEVCGYIAFIACDEESQYFGYWRGPERRPIAESPVVFLDNEGSFQVRAGSNFAEGLYEERATYYGQQPGELRDWMRSIGIRLTYDNPDDVPYPTVNNPPDELHQKLYKLYTA